MLRFILPLMLLGMMAPATASYAQSPAQAATSWGLIGTWRFTCGAPPDRIDSILVFVVRGGRLYHDRNWGEGTDSSVIPSATIRPDGTLDLLISFTSLSQTRENLLKKMPDGRVLVINSRNVDNDQYTIKDGKAVSSGEPMTLLTRCSVP